MELDLEKIAETIEIVKIRTCEALPLNWTIYGETGVCEKPNLDCKYIGKESSRIYICKKKTTTLYDDRYSVPI